MGRHAAPGCWGSCAGLRGGFPLRGAPYLCGGGGWRGRGRGGGGGGGPCCPLNECCELGSQFFFINNSTLSYRKHSKQAKRTPLLCYLASPTQQNLPIHKHVQAGIEVAGLKLTVIALLTEAKSIGRRAMHRRAPRIPDHMRWVTWKRGVSVFRGIGYLSKGRGRRGCM